MATQSYDDNRSIVWRGANKDGKSTVESYSLLQKETKLNHSFKSKSNCFNKRHTLAYRITVLQRKYLGQTIYTWKY